MTITTIGLIDTHDFCQWAQQKYNISNNEWHDIIWRPFMVDYFDNGNIVTFQRKSLPENILGEHIADLLDENPELQDTVSFIFTN